MSLELTKHELPLQQYSNKKSSHRIWIIQAIRMPKVKSSKQNCLEHGCKGRVGVGGGLSGLLAEI